MALLNVVVIGRQMLGAGGTWDKMQPCDLQGVRIVIGNRMHVLANEHTRSVSQSIACR